MGWFWGNDNKSKKQSSRKTQNNIGESLHEKRVRAGRAGGSASHECRGLECPRKAGSMSAKEVGQLGGSALHECRGRACSSDDSE